jgi:hypothetical protein
VGRAQGDRSRRLGPVRMRSRVALLELPSTARSCWWASTMNTPTVRWVYEHGMVRKSGSGISQSPCSSGPIETVMIETDDARHEDRRVPCGST